MSSGEESRLLRCSQCGAFYPARSSEKRKLVPSGGKCTNCGIAEFEQVILASSD
ncbi:MAG TPA: hypothetical protein VFJ06_00825 [Halococcus sp.]|nr:hypothetical protein [Halococcus sp.]